MWQHKRQREDERARAPTNDFYMVLHYSLVVEVRLESAPMVEFPVERKAGG
jgi:hypothetical protein